MRDSWKKIAIGEVCKTYAGGTPNRENSSYYNGDIPWVSSGEVNQNYILDTKEKITKNGLLFSSAKWIPKEAILLAMYGATAGQVSKLKINATSNQAVLALVPDEADDYFIYHELNFIKNRILFLAQGSGQSNLSKSLVDSTLIDFPPLPQQQKIAKILSTCDEVIEKTEAAITKYQALKQGMMHDLFTRGIDVKTGKLRPRFEDAPELYRESELGTIPKEWEVKELNELTTKIVDGTHFTPNYTESGVPFLRVTDMQTDRIDFKNIKFVSEHEHKQLLLRCNPEKGDILYSKNGTIGIPKLVDWDWEFSIFVSLALIKLKREIILPEYLLLVLPEDLIWKQIRKRTKQGTVANLHLEEIREFLIPLPNSAEQRAIISRGEVINMKIQTEQSTLSKYQQLKAGLMQDLLTGKVEVSVEDEAIK